MKKSHPWGVLRGLGAAVCALALAPASARAWHGGGHEAIARAALAQAGGAVPEFLVQGSNAVAYTSRDPDLFVGYGVEPLKRTERPDHFIDLELLGGDALPVTRAEYVQLCARQRVDPYVSGFLPYALAEWTQRLTVALAQHRAWPTNEAVRQKCLVYAGLMTHYSADLCQPLHLTVHYDGRVAKPRAPSPRSGIHGRVDGLFEAGPPTQPAAAAPGAGTNAVWSVILQEIAAGRARVDACYALDERLQQGKTAADDDAVQAFARERFSSAAAFTATLLKAAWRDAQQVTLPPWQPPPR